MNDNLSRAVKKQNKNARSICIFTMQRFGEKELDNFAHVHRKHNESCTEDVRRKRERRGGGGGGGGGGVDKISRR